MPQHKSRQSPTPCAQSCASAALKAPSLSAVGPYYQEAATAAAAYPWVDGTREKVAVGCLKKLARCRYCNVCCGMPLITNLISTA